MSAPGPEERALGYRVSHRWHGLVKAGLRGICPGHARNMRGDARSEGAKQHRPLRSEKERVPVSWAGGRRTERECCQRPREGDFEKQGVALQFLATKGETEVKHALG